MDGLSFQPRVALSDGRVDGLEALLPSAAGVPDAEQGWRMVADAVSAMKLWAGCGFHPRVWLPVPRGALAARAHMAGYAELHGIVEGRLLYMEAPHVLAIDAAMMDEALESRRARHALGALLERAHGGGMASCAQGVSNLLHWEMLRELGCGYASGEFIAPQRLAPDVPDALCTWGAQHAAMSAVYAL